MIDTSCPFVLLDDASGDPAACARLYADPARQISAHTLDDVIPALEAVRAALRSGLHVAGWLAYEAGLALEPRLIARARRHMQDGPLLWFGVFERVAMLTPDEVRAALPDPDGARVSAFRPRVSAPEYRDAFARAHAYIRAGDIYQANLTLRADIDVAGDPLALYAQVREAGQGRWGGVVFDGASWLLSTSPELFFSLRDGVIVTRPMKGTARRDADPEKDCALAAALARDPKERAENLMIVDLLRNDLSRIAARGSVETPALFSVETYPTVHALTSTIRATLGPGCDAVDVLKALFPCGSVTGAPKIRAMEIIDELERDRRGAYTGSIGWMSPDGDAEFNVTIRTLALREGGGAASVGLGSGVVYDSNADAEWAECHAKGAFLTANRPRFDLIETMRFERAAGVAFLDLHVARLRRSAEALGFVFDETAVRTRLEASVKALDGARRLRLLLSPEGAIAIDVQGMPAAPDGPVAVAVARRPVSGSDFRLRHKTSSRAFHDETRAASGAWEVIFVDDEGCVTEGSFTNVFLKDGAHLLTPPLGRGLLPGVLRESLLAEGKAKEADFGPRDLANGFYIGNALRGLIPARLR